MNREIQEMIFYVVLTIGGNININVRIITIKTDDSETYCIDIIIEQKKLYQ